jgi:acetate kinase
MRDLTQAAIAGDQRSQLALDVFTRAIRHYVGAFMLSLGGIDAITFSGGIGENSAETRSAVLKDMSGFGVELDENRNWAIKGEGAISNGRSAITVLIVPANEEMIVARETAAVVGRAIAANQTLAGKAS